VCADDEVLKSVETNARKSHEHTLVVQGESYRESRRAVTVSHPSEMCGGHKRSG
jgi:hypothetical protein